MARRVIRVGLILGALLLLAPVVLSAQLLAAAGVNGALGVWSLRSARAESSPAEYGDAAAQLGRAASDAGAAGQLWGRILQPVGVGTPLLETSRAVSTLGAAAQIAAPAVPVAMGADRPHRYLVAALNDAELFGSGGAPLYVSMVEMKKGQLSTPVSGTTGESISPDAPGVAWDIVGGPPWYQQGLLYPFVNSGFHPQFPYSGENMMRAWQALGYPPLDGVITLDVQAVANILAETGPIQTQGYGELTADNVTRKVLVDAYRQYPVEVAGNNAIRRGFNDELRRALGERMTSPSHVAGIMRGLAASIPGRHMQAYMVDPQLQQSVEVVGADGAMATAPGDILGVFLQSGVSKLAIFQRRQISQEVVIGEDGSAKVTREVVATNAVPSDVQGDPTTNYGYLALVFTQQVAYRIPATATNATVSTPAPLVAAGQTGPYPDDVGAQVMWQGQNLSPGQSMATTVTYELPPGTFGSGAQRFYLLTGNPQAFTTPVGVDLRVRFAGQNVPQVSGAGWTRAGDTFTWSGQLDRSLDLQLRP